MAAGNTTNYENLLQIVYPTERLIDETIQDCPTWKRIKEVNTLTGEGHTFAVPYAGNDGGIGTTISACQAGLGHTEAAKFHLDRKTLLGVIQIDNELLDVGFKNRGAFVDVFEQENRSTLDRFKARLGASVFGSGGGAIGQISAGSDVATATITLADPRDAIKFRPGMIINTDSTNGDAGTGTANAGSGTVKTVDYVNGTVETTNHWNDDHTGVAASHYIFPYGDFQAGATGFAGYCPSSAPAGSESFLGFDRSIAPDELAGVRIAADGGTVEDALINAVFEMLRLNRNIKQCIMNPYLIRTLVREQGTRSQYIRTDSSKVVMGASELSLIIPGGRGPIEIISDPYCQSLIAWLVNLEQWKRMASDSGAPHFVKNPDGGRTFQVYNANSTEMRMAAYYNFKCTQPRNVGRVTFS